MKLTRDQFERMALEQIDLLYRVARRLTHHDAAAEDLVQETYVRAIRSWETFHLQEFGIRPWLIRILHNIHYSTSRRDSRQPVAVEQDHLEAASGNGAGYTNGNGNGHHETLPPLRLDSLDAMDQRLVRALNRLPEEYRVVMLLWAVEEFSYKEIADAVEVPIGTVMSRLHRAKQRLAEQLQDFARDHRILRE